MINTNKNLLISLVYVILSLIFSGNSNTMDCIDGNVYNDLNYNGIQNAEPGIENITVEIYDCNNLFIGSTLTNNLGYWQICGLADNIEYRVEFVLNASQSTMYGQSISGDNSNTNVQFAVVNSTISYGLLTKDPSPLLFTPCYSYGGYQGLYKDVEAFVGVPINKLGDPTLDANTGTIKYATHEEIGSTYGLAIDSLRNKAYVAAYLKRHSGFGPGGTGAIYEVDLSNLSPPSILADLNIIYGPNTAGINPHDYSEIDVCPAPNSPDSNSMCWFNDVDSWNLVGKTSLGDIDITPDMSTLYAMNLEDRSVYSVDLTNPGMMQSVFSFPLDQDVDPNVTLKPRDPAYDIRPFGLKYHNGLLYVAAVDTEQSRDRDNICCPKGGAVVYVYSLDPNTGIWTLVLEEDIQKNGPGPGTPFFIHWHDEFKDSFEDNANMLVSDIEFDGQDIILGLRDKSSDNYGYLKGKPIEGDSTVTASYESIAGDVVRFCYDTATSTYNFENNGSCGGITTSGAGFNNIGWPESTTPRGSYYTGDYFSSQHPQTSLGGIWQDPNDDVVFVSSYDILQVFEGGIRSLNNTTGLVEENYVLIPSTDIINGFGKASGLGDMEGGSLSLPIEIGNRVWCDSIENGIQDACEIGLSNMVIQLFSASGDLIGQDTTQSNGQYYFNSTNVDTTGITVDVNGNASPNNWTNLGSNTKYFIIYGNGQFDNSNQVFTIEGEEYNGIATHDANSNNSDSIDSDVDSGNLSIAMGAIPAGLPQICMTTNSNCVDHNFDLGVNCPDICDNNFCYPITVTRK
jgi:hypothetical protein